MGYSQALMVAYGPAYTGTKQVVPIVNGVRGGAYDSDFSSSLTYEHFFNQRSISIFGSLNRFKGDTFIFFEKGGVIENGNELAAVGFSGVKISRFDIGMTYLLTNRKNKFYFKPFLAGGFQVSKKTGEEIYSEAAPIKGPNYFELEPISAVPLNTIQIVPSVGFRTGIVFWKRLDLGLTFQGVLGHKPYQKMYFKYEYKGVPQKTGEFEANGTGLYVTLGVGYRFAKLIK